MNIKIYLSITLIIAIAFTSCAEARSKTTKRRKHNHKSNDHHSEGSRNAVKNNYHSTGTSKQQDHNTITENRKASHIDATQNNHQPIHNGNIQISQQPFSNTNTHHQAAQSSENGDFVAGYIAGSAKARRSHRRHRTTVAPTTTTKTPCSNDASVSNNNQQTTQQKPTFNCEAISATTNIPAFTNID